MELTPGMKQYMEVKDKHPDCLVLFRMGDFYETFYEDAKIVARDLDIVLTARGKGEKRAPLAGIPYHALESYLGKLVRMGHKVCLVEQLEDPKKAKGLVKRGVVRIITPGTVIEDSILSKNSNNYIMSISPEKDRFGIAVADVSTGEFLASVAQGNQKLLGELQKFNPAEIILPAGYEQSAVSKVIRDNGFIVNSFDDFMFYHERAKKTIMEKMGTQSVECFGLSDKDEAVSASGALLSYLSKTQMNSLQHIRAIKSFNIDSFMVLDASTQRNLEILRNIRDQSARGTLYAILNKTSSAMGARLLKRWLTQPLIDRVGISQRLDAVEELYSDAILLSDLRESLSTTSDIERISARLSYGTANARDLISLKQTILNIPKIENLLKSKRSDLLKCVRQKESLKNLAGLIQTAIIEEPSAQLRDGNIIKKGYSRELDELKTIASAGKEFMTKLEERERVKTGIKSLKVRYNRVFGYFIEVTKTNLHLVPESYIRKQTQANCERFITEELKAKEDMILGAQEKIASMEFSLFFEVADKAIKMIADIQELASSVGALDCIASLARCAAEHSYCRPKISDDSHLDIVEGRHPTVELMADAFVQNGCQMDEDNRMMIITGPNMSGKSTYLRQVALIALMAQTGSFVPAKKAAIPIFDRIFSRVGAYDDLSMGQSTFMVEMSETANILNSATARSLIILDEIGRGTSTYDGFSLAWAIAEHIARNIRAKTIFATHYHQLNKLSESVEGVRNYHIQIAEEGDRIVFLRKILEGGTDKSYGVHVARLAGIPGAVIERAGILMETLEEEDKIMHKLEAKVAGQKRLAKGMQDRKHAQTSTKGIDGSIQRTLQA